ncbi:Leucine-rich receptor-like protein kinase family protein [Thalictrum thalictroides]|uniref:Leucine-rich receptor-like protein kinase family protein n=1 Tax=Thalictrum thalictroides TaxID=46969 RepID=A0A7J6WBV2_THATH|nr:Leucine-rich receptor-like protein kinase family protein [Thalictrum thalictroides]
MCLVLVLIQYATAFSIGNHHLLQHQENSLLTDKTTLLAFKKTITPDSQSALENWAEKFDVCNFTGVVCSPSRHRVFKLLLNNTNIEGLISPFIANLTGLRKLDLSQNKLFGLIPTEFSQLRFLWFLKLDGNLLHGKIPESLSFLSRLRYVHFGGNFLSGNIPASIFSNCTSLRYVDFSNNSLSGEIPSEVWKPQELWGLNLYVNNMSGKIPLSLANASNLYTLDLENNHFKGELPSEVVSKLYWLTNLHLSYNDMVSHDSNTNLVPFLASLINCTYLEELELAGMGLGGRLSSTIGLLSTTLSKIHLEDNRIFGMIPPNVANLSNLTLLNLSSNLLNGTIPVEIGQLEKLEQLILSDNSFSGRVPATLGQIHTIGLLDLSRNRLTGVIPASLGDLSLLNYLFLNNNYLSGAIPSSLGKCRDLHKLDLSYNRLTGRIPPDISGLGEIRIFLNLSHNLLQGPLPYELSKLESVQQIDLSSNNLTGNIYPQLSNCISINLLNLAHNSFQGQLPESLGELRNLESLDVSNNYLSGSIPASFSKCPSLTSLNVSFNDFNGPIPTGGIFKSVTYLAFLGNPHLCGSVTGIPICLRKTHSLHSRKFLPSNVLLNDDMTALVSDFGIAKLVMTVGVGNSALVENMGNSTANILCGSIGYIAPEYGYGSSTSTKGDVYSFGMLVLEMVTRKRPTDDMFNGGLSLHKWVKNHYHGRVEKVIDFSLVRATRNQSPEVMKMWEVAIAELLELGLLCTQEIPSTRPTMLDAADDLDRLKRYLDGDTTATFASSLGISSSTLDDD